MSHKSEPNVDLELAKEHGLTEEEYGWIIEKLGRTPTFVELGIYSVMWSEHCSYKNSIALLKTLPRSGENLLVEAGDENAGLVDIGGGLACAFKIESHNHPSAVEPYQGAATGVGGIQRDIFTMGARPIASLNSLRFGSLDSERVKFLLDGVVRGIGDYGNSFGVPTVGGEIYFDDCYEENPLVNAMSVGIVKVGETVSAIASGAGNPVFIVGSSTGRDGIHGATFASEEISEESEAKRPSVQVGDPFTEKLLLEASLEVIATGALVGMQDMGAAGITCSSAEMSEKGGCGMRLQLEKVPIREKGMTPYEIMLSESQERMLVVCHKGREQEVIDVFEKWDLNVEEIGVVTDTGNVEIFFHGELFAEIPAEHLCLGAGAPVYIRETSKPEYLTATSSFDQSTVEDLSEESVPNILLNLLGNPNIASKKWVYEQYDTMVRTNTIVGPGSSDAAVVRIKGTDRGLAVKTDCNGRYVYLNPRKGAQIAVAESARNVVCSGGQPVAVTNCLNFGNPYKPQMYWVFKEAVAGMGEACRKFETPVTGGNVSLYNESPGRAVYPTPTIGMLGLVDDIHNHVTTSEFKNEGDHIFLLTPKGNAFASKIDGSEYLASVRGQVTGDAPEFELDEELAVQKAALKMIRSGLIQSAHDISDGGLGVCLAEKTLYSGLGAKVDLTTEEGQRLDALFFGEAQSRIIFSAKESNAEKLYSLARSGDVQLNYIGQVVSDESLDISVDGNLLVSLDSSELKDPYFSAIPDAMKS